MALVSLVANPRVIYHSFLPQVRGAAISFFSRAHFHSEALRPLASRVNVLAASSPRRFFSATELHEHLYQVKQEQGSRTIECMTSLINLINQVHILHDVVNSSDQDKIKVSFSQPNLFNRLLIKQLDHDVFDDYDYAPGDEVVLKVLHAEQTKYLQSLKKVLDKATSNIRDRNIICTKEQREMIDLYQEYVAFLTKNDKEAVKRSEEKLQSLEYPLINYIANTATKRK